MTHPHTTDPEPDIMDSGDTTEAPPPHGGHYSPLEASLDGRLDMSLQPPPEGRPATELHTDGRPCTGPQPPLNGRTFSGLPNKGSHTSPLSATLPPTGPPPSKLHLPNPAPRHTLPAADSTDSIDSPLPSPSGLATRTVPTAGVIITTTRSPRSPPCLLSQADTESQTSPPESPMRICKDCGTLAILSECEPCQLFFCENCTQTDLDRGLTWCHSCRAEQSGHLDGTSSVSSMEHDVHPTKPLPTGASPPRQTIAQGDNASMPGSSSRRSRSASLSSSRTTTSEDSNYSQKSTKRARRRRVPRKRSNSHPAPKSNILAETPNMSPMLDSSLAQRKRSSQPTLEAHLRPRRAHASYRT